MDRHNAPERIWFLDTLRYWLVVLIILYHSAAAHSPFLWPVNNPALLKSAEWLIVVLDAFVMPLFFVVAGYFFLPSMR